MLVRDILAQKPDRTISVAPDATLQDAVRVMTAERIGSLLIVDAAGGLAGILSERDVVKIMAQSAGGQEARPVHEFATKTVITCTEDSTLSDVLTLMGNNVVRHLPVMRDGRLVGMISARDLINAQKEEMLATLSRQKQAYTLMKRAKEQAERTDRSKTEFMRNMSHELCTPLNAIIGFGEIIAGQALGRIGNDKYAEMGREIAAAGGKLLALINDILAMTRLESGKWPVSDNDLDLAALVAASVAAFADAAREKDIRIETVGPELPLRLIGDEEMVLRMLDNLLSNAVKFTRDSGAVTVRVALTDGEGARIDVADTGVGIPPDAIEQVLTPFIQVDGSLTREYEGTGLGLALVNRMIEAHEGEISIASREGEGTTVSLCFPAARTIVGFSPRRAAG
jgi:signal transduction histidine kinase